MRITNKGQVRIPVEIREKAGLLPGTEVDFIYDGKVVQIVRAPATEKAAAAASSTTFAGIPETSS